MSYKLMRIDELAGQPLSQELIPGLLDDGLILAIAKEGNGKTFFGVHCAVHVASGAKWQGRNVNQGPVVYCIAEGVSFFGFRITTAFDALKVRTTGQPLYILPHSINLRSDTDGKLTKELDDLFLLISRLEVAPRLIVFDTLNRYMPGGDENNQQDCSSLVRGCEYLREQFKCSVMLMHHMRKDGKFARGSTVLTAAADQVIYCDSDNGDLLSKPIKWTTKDRGKRKDREAIEQWFRFKKVVMTRGDLCGIQKEWESYIDYTVLKTDYDDEGNEFDTNTVEETLVMEPVTHVEGEEGAGGVDPDMELVKGLIDGKDGGIGVRALIRDTGWSQKKVYKVVDGLVEAGVVFQNDEKRYQVGTGNPFADT